MNKLPSREELIASGNEVAEKAWASVKTAPVQRNTGAIIPLGKRQLQVKVRELEQQIELMKSSMRIARNAIASAIDEGEPLLDREQLLIAHYSLSTHIGGR